MLGNDNVYPYDEGITSYEKDMNPTILNEVATAGFRFGHTLLTNFIQRYLFKESLEAQKFSGGDGRRGYNIVSKLFLCDPIKRIALNYHLL